MTKEERKQINRFVARTRQLILQYQTLQDENIRLTTSLAEQADNIKTLQTQLQDCQKRYETLKTAKMMEISDGDIKAAKQRINRLVRNVDKCIGIITAAEADSNTQE
ncbi:MAG: hypothetical protein IJ139_07800 [Bacteroidaceae bacterium]|jgi:phage shock protein A|nr:hypothetical protein [Paludibacteraceae bacterium]MBQ8676715.1 hypothetical protein [Bacteroidaceae bacterium]MBQ9176756.1 hypothetical protein [Bacteroidaceae bacterium]MBR1378132.1 hypothetical protein [Bacteroidaceae bacterium]